MKEKMDLGAPGKHGTPELASLIRESRVRMDLSQEELAKKVGVSRSLVNEVEHMRSPLTHEETVSAFSRELGVDENDIYAAGGVIPPDLVRMIRAMDAGSLRRLRTRLGN